MLLLVFWAQLTCGVTVSTPITFSPGPAAQATSTLVASPNTVVANGTSQVTLTFTTKDAYNNVPVATAVNLSASGGNNIFGAASGSTNASGVFTTTLTSTLAQSEIITASFGSGLTVTTLVQFVPGAASSATSSVVLSPNTQIANNSNTVVALLTLRDAKGNALANVTPTFAASGSSTTVSSPAATSTAGQSSANYQTALAQNENALVTAGGLSFISSMVFVAGPAVAASSTLATNPNIAAGNGSSAISLVSTARDSQGNLASGVAIALSASGGNNTFANATGTTNSSGTYTTTLTSIQMQTETITATFATNFTKTASVTFTGAASTATSTLTVNPNSVVAGPNNVMTGTLTLKDAASNPLAGITSGWSASGTNNTVTHTGNTTAAGVATATYTTTKAQNQNATVTSGGITLSVPISIVAGSPNATISNFYALPARQLANNSNVIRAGVTLNDAYQNPISGQTATFSASGVSTNVSGPVATDTSGLAQATYASSVVQNENAIVNVAGLTYTAPLYFTTTPASCSLVASPSSQPSDGNSPINLTATVLDANGVGVPNLLTLFSTSGGPNTFKPNAAISDAQGMAQSIVSALSTGTNKLIAQAANVQCTAQGNFIATTPFCAGSPNFLLSTLSVGANAINVTTGYLNDDAYLDLATANYSANSISVFLGSATGTFQAQTTVPTGSLPRVVISADFNQDGFSDLATSNNGTVTAFLGGGDGTFRQSASYTIGATNYGLGAADVNLDGVVDLVVGSSNNILYIMLGTGFGTFRTPLTFTASGLINYLAIGDFNADGNPDVTVAAYNNSSMNIFLGNGDGTFNAETTYPVGGRTTGITVGDVNADGKLDVLVSNGDGGYVHIFLGTGNGSFSANTAFNVGSGVNNVVLADINGDGTLDMLAAMGGNSFSVAMGNGSGGFASTINFATGYNTKYFAVGDFNNDKRVDFVTIGSGTTMPLLLSQGCLSQ